MTRKGNRFAQAAKLSRSAAEVALGKAVQSPENIEALSPGEKQQTLHEEKQKTLHERKVCQIDLEMQNEELRRTQVELDALRARYFDLYDIAPVGYCTIGETGLILESNLAAATLLGAPRETLTKQFIFSFILPEDQEIYYLHRRQLFETGMPQVCELRMMNKAGAVFWARMEATITQDSAGARMCRVAMSDIHKYKRAEEALRKCKLCYRELFDNIGSGVAIYEVKGTGDDFIFKDRNKAGDRLDGDRREDILGTSIFQTGPGIKEFGLLNVFKRVWQTGLSEHYPASFYDDHKLKKWFENYVYKIESGEIVAVYDDVTERKCAEDALLHAHQRLRRFIDANIVGVVIANPTGVVIDANGYYLEVIGYTREEFEKGMVDWRAVTPPEWLPADEHAIEELRERGTCTPYEKEYIRRDGTRVTVFISNVILPGPEEPIAAFVLDITERKRAEIRLCKLNRTYALLSSVNQTIVRVHERQELIEAACRIAVAQGDFHMAWVGLLDTQTGNIRPAAHAGKTEDYLEKLSITMDDSERGHGPTATAQRTGQRVIVNDIRSDPHKPLACRRP